MQKVYNVLQQLVHDNQRIEVGGTVNLTDEQAAPLLILAVVSDTGKFVQAKDAFGAPIDPEVRLTDIKSAIATLDPNNLDQWLKDGKPSLDAIAAITGWPVTAVERNAALMPVTA